MTQNTLTDLADIDLPSDAFWVESHTADAMPNAHWHDHIEINYLPTGKMSYLLNGRRVTLQPRRIGVFWAANHHQAIKVETDQTLICAYIPASMFFGLQLSPEFRASILRGELVQLARQSDVDGARFREMLDGFQGATPAMRQIILEELLLRLRRMSLQSCTNQTIEDPEDTLIKNRGAVHNIQQVERMAEFINAHIDQPLRVPEIAASIGIHPTTARAAFQRVFGITIGHFVRRQRVNYAMRLLAETDLDMAGIAHTAGYSSLPRLYDAFQGFLGKTPAAYRREIRRT